MQPDLEQNLTPSPESISEESVIEYGPSDEVLDTVDVSQLDQDPDAATWFHAEYIDCMEMFADLDTVATYLGQHRGWFCRCARPMKAEPLGENGYDLLIGRFGALGYRVEARIGLDLIPPDETGIYRILTIPVPGYQAPGYEVDFQSTMKLVELPLDQIELDHNTDPEQFPTIITGAAWQLNLAVGVWFPKFIRTMSPTVIQKTGDALLYQIVRQVSRQLTYKTQMDFHTTLNLPFPKKYKRK